MFKPIKIYLSCYLEISLNFLMIAVLEKVFLLFLIECDWCSYGGNDQPLLKQQKYWYKILKHESLNNIIPKFIVLDPVYN